MWFSEKSARALAQTSYRDAGGWPEPITTKAGCIVPHITMSALVYKITACFSFAWHIVRMCSIYTHWAVDEAARLF